MPELRLCDCGSGLRAKWFVPGPDGEQTLICEPCHIFRLAEAKRPARRDLSQIGADAWALYLAEAAAHDLLTREEEQRLGRLLHGPNPEHAARARALLVDLNQRLVIRVALNWHSVMPMEERIAAGNEGLLHALTKWNPEAGFKLSTYAIWWIRQTITRTSADQSRTIRLPVHVHDKLIKLNRAYSQLEQRGAAPTPEALAARLDWSLDQVIHLIQWRRGPISLDMPLNDDDDAEDLGYFVPDLRADVEEQSASLFLRETLHQVLECLDARERKIIELRYGLRDGHAQTLEVVASKYGLTRERIRQIEAKALRKLRHPSRARQLRAFLEA